MAVLSNQMSNSLFVTPKTITNRKSVYPAVAATILAIMCFAIVKTWGISVLQYIGALIMILVIISVDETTALFLILIVAPSTYYTKIGGTSICGYLCILALFKAVVIKHIIPRTSIIFIVSMMMTFCFFTALLNSEIGIIAPAVKMISFFLLFSITIQTNRRALKPICMKLCRGYILGTFVSLTLGILYYLIQDRSIFSYYDYRFSGLCIDPNYFSSTLMFSIAIIISIAFRQKKIKIAEITIFVYFSIFGLITLSRAFTLTYAVIISLAGLCLLFIRRIKVFKMVAIIIAILVAMFLLRKPISVIMEGITIRLTDSTLANGGGRLDLWSWYMNKLASSISTLLFGAGSSFKYLASGIMRSVEHSVYVEMLFTYGICGFLCSLFTYLTINRSIKLYSSANRIQMTDIFPILTVLLVNAFISLSTNENFVFGVMLACMFLHVANEKEDPFAING